MTRRLFDTTPSKILFQNIDSLGAGTYRMLLPASLLRRHGHAMAQAHSHTITQDAIAVLDPDVVVFQLHQTQQHIARIKNYRKALPNAFFLYEIDDAFWNVPEGSWHFTTNPLLKDSKANIKTAAKLCDGIVVSTSELADAMTQLTGMKNVRVARNHLPKAFITAALAGRRSSDAKHSDKPRIGWAGGMGHGGDLRIVSEIMRELGDSVVWSFMGAAPPGTEPGPNVDIHPGCPYNDYPRGLGIMNLDIALAPLEANPFNTCKSDLRVLEYAAAGFPVIASECNTYKNCPVVTAPYTAEAWLAAIDKLLVNKTKRDEYAEDLHAWVTANRVMEDHLDSRVRAYLPRNTEPFRPRSGGAATGQVVTVGVTIGGLSRFATVREAWEQAPGADLLYVRENTDCTEGQAARMIAALEHNASVTAFSNDGVYPHPEQHPILPTEIARNIDLAAMMTAGDLVPCCYPAGPGTLLAGHALTRYGLPDEDRFGDFEHALVEWGARVLETGGTHALLPTVFINTTQRLPQPPEARRRAIEHIGMWSPVFIDVLQRWQHSPPLAMAREDLDLAYNALFHTAPEITSYADWHTAFDTLTDADRAAIRTDEAKREAEGEAIPHFSIVLPVYNPNPAHLLEALASVRTQTWKDWSLCICDDASTDPKIIGLLKDFIALEPRSHIVWRGRNGHICEASNDAMKLAQDGWVVFLDHDDTLAPDALTLFANEIRAHPDVQFLYSDADKISPEGEYVHPYFAPDFAYELLLAQNYVTHLSAYRLDGIRAVGGLAASTEGAQDWDLVLRYLTHTCGSPPDPKLIRHIPHALYHWRISETSTSGDVRNKPYAAQAGRNAVTRHLHATGQAAVVSAHPVLDQFCQVRFLVPTPPPKVTILIPTRDNGAQLGRCLEGLLRRTAYENFEIMVLDNGSKDPPTLALLKEVERERRVKVNRWSVEPFNYAEINNRTVARTDAEFICLLNDDTEVIEGSWLNDMVGLAMRPQVGAVGAKLLYPDGRVQACGTFVDTERPNGVAAFHAWTGLGAFETGQTGRALLTSPTVAVTAACLVIRRSLYESIGGLDSGRFAIDFNDVDLCLRLHKAGYRNIVSTPSLMRHYEGQTKKRIGNWKREQLMAAEQVLLDRHPDFHDPYANPNLVFEPTLSMLSNDPPPKPWRDEQRLRTLMVNPSKTDTLLAFQNGELPYSVSLQGHYMTMAQPVMNNVRPFDLRQPIDEVETLLAKLNVVEIVFHGIGDGTLGALGFFAALAEKGWPVRYLSKAEQGNEHGYYDSGVWFNAWQRFTTAAARSVENASVTVAAD